MALNIKDIAQIVNYYRANVGYKALPTNVNLTQMDQQVGILTTLLEKSKDGKLAITSQQELQQVIRATNMLSSVNKLDDIKDIRNKIQEGTERYNKYINVMGRTRDPKKEDAFATKEKIVEYANYRTYGDLKRTMEEWTRKKDRIYFPTLSKQTESMYNNNPLLFKKYREYNAMSQAKVQDYLEIAESLPKDIQNRAIVLLQNVRDPNTILEDEKNENTTRFDQMLKRLASSNANKGQYLDNTLIHIGELSKEEIRALYWMNTMSQLPEQNEAMRRETDSLKQFQNIYNQFKAPSVADVEAYNKSLAEQRAKAGEKDIANSIEEKMKKGTPLDQFTKEEQQHLAEQAKQEGISVNEFYESEQQYHKDLAKQQALKAQQAKGTIGAQNPTQIGQNQTVINNPASQGQQGGVTVKSSKAAPTQAQQQPGSSSTTQTQGASSTSTQPSPPVQQGSVTSSASSANSATTTQSGSAGPTVQVGQSAPAIPVAPTASTVPSAPAAPAQGQSTSPTTATPVVQTQTATQGPNWVLAPTIPETTTTTTSLPSVVIADETNTGIFPVTTTTTPTPSPVVTTMSAGAGLPSANSAQPENLARPSWIPKNATAAEARTIYRQRLMQIHPDFNPNDVNATDKTRQLIEEYERYVKSIQRGAQGQVIAGRTVGTQPITGSSATNVPTLAQSSGIAGLPSGTSSGGSIHPSGSVPPGSLGGGSGSIPPSGGTPTAGFPQLPGGIPTVKIPQAKKDIFLLRAEQRRDFFTRKLFIEGDWFGAFADMPSLVGPSYEKQAATWVGGKLKKLGKSIKTGIGNGLSAVGRYIGDGVSDLAYGVYNYLGRKLSAVPPIRFIKNTAHGIRMGYVGIRNSIARKYLKWEQRSVWAGVSKSNTNIIKIRPLIRKHGLLGKKGLLGFKKKKRNPLVVILEEIFKRTIGAVFKGIQLAATKGASFIQNAQALGRIPKSLANMATSVYAKLNQISGLNVQATAQGAAQGISNAVLGVRSGFAHFALRIGEAVNMIRGAGRIVGAVGKGIPNAVLAGIAVGLSTQTLGIGAAVGALTLVSQGTVNLLGTDFSDLIKNLDAQGIGSWGKFAKTIMEKIQGVGWGKYNQVISGVGNVAPELAAEVAKHGIFSAKWQFGLRAGNTGMLFAAIADPILVALLGPVGHLAALGVGVGAGLVKLAVDNVFNKFIQKSAGLVKLFSIPLLEGFSNVLGISQLGIELSILQVKYKWNIQKYFENEFKLSENGIERVWGSVLLGLRGLNFVGGVSALVNAPRVLLGFFKAPFMQGLLSKWGLGGLSLMKGIVWPSIIGSIGGFAALAAFVPGIVFTPTVILLGTIGGFIGTFVGTWVAGLVAGSSLGIGLVASPFIVGFFNGVGTFLGGWLGSWIDKTFGAAMSLFNLAVNGIQALLQLISILRNGISLDNILSLIMALASLITTFNYMQTMSGTNSCSTPEECAKQNTNTIQAPATNHLAYYNVTIMSADSNSHNANIRRIIALLDAEPGILDTTYGNRRKYIYIGKTNDIYANDENVVIGVTQNSLYTNNSITAIFEAVNGQRVPQASASSEITSN